MKLQITKLKSKTMSLSKIKLKVLSRILFLSSGVLFVLSIISFILSKMGEGIGTMAMTRVYTPSTTYSIYASYAWGLLVTAVLLFITALALLIIPFKKLKK